jgi:hypothetical protein
MRFRIHHYVAALKSEVFNLREEPKVANFVPFLFSQILQLAEGHQNNCADFHLIQRGIFMLKFEIDRNRSNQNFVSFENFVENGLILSTNRT